MAPDLTLLLVPLLTMAVASIARAWLRYRQAVAVERWRTERLRSALRTVDPPHRAEMITACASLESASHSPVADPPSPPPAVRRA